MLRTNGRGGDVTAVRVAGLCTAAVLAALPAAAAARTAASSDLSVTQVGSAESGHVGDTITYTVTVRNGGPDLATGVILREALTGAKATITSASGNPGGACSLGTTQRRARCEVGSLAGGQTVQLTFAVILAGSGPLTLTADVAGKQADPDTSNQQSVVTTTATETTPPTDLTLTGSAFDKPFAARPGFSVVWHAVDTGSKIGSYEVRYRSATPTGGFGPFLAWKAGPETHATFGGRAGSSYCFSFRAVDRDGNASGWSEERCVAILLDGGAAARTGKWTMSPRGPGAPGSARARDRGATLTLSKLYARRISVSFVRCPTCGSAAVLWRGKPLRTLDLRARSTTRALVEIASFPAPRSGTLAVKVTSDGRTVTVAAFGIAKR
jgi:hypothetical protein